MKTILRNFIGAIAAIMALPMLFALPASAEQAGPSAKSAAPAAPIILAQRVLTPEEKAKLRAKRKAKKRKAKKNKAKRNNPNAVRNKKGNNPKARANRKGNNPKAKANRKLRDQRKALQKRKALKKRRTKNIEAEQKFYKVKPPSAKRQKELRAQDARKRLQKKKQRTTKQRQLQRKDKALDARARRLRETDRRLDARKRALNRKTVKRRKIQTRQIKRNNNTFKRLQKRRTTLAKQINTNRNRTVRLKRRNNRLTRQRNWLLAQRRTNRRRTAWQNFRFRQRARTVRTYRNRTLFAAFAGAAVGAAIVGSYYVYHNDNDRIYGWRSRDAYLDNLNNGWTRSVVVRPNGVRVVTIRDGAGFIVRRYRVYSGNRVVMLYDNQPRWWDDDELIVDVKPVRYSGRDYIVEPSEASIDDVYDAVVADPVADVDRKYTLNQILMNRNLRDYMPRIDLDTINFSSGSAEIPDRELDTLDEVGAAMEAAIKENPDEVYLIEGHTDAVGDSEMNAVLSDERAASVANALTQYYDIPPENLVTQGYGEDFLKVETRGAERRNRRVAIRRITPLLANESDDIALDDDGNEIFENL